MSRFKDHFSSQADAYARHRPGYPAALFDWLAGAAPRRRLAWDVATGNGQAAQGLAERFRRVVATDASVQQLLAADRHPGVHFRLERAETSSLPAAAVDLVTVGQALHWFDLGRFNDEVVRVAAPDALLAVWSYRLMRVAPTIDGVLERWMFEILAPCWPPERLHVETRYRDLDLPIEPLDTPDLRMRRTWSARQALDYIGTWSATRRFRQRHGDGALAGVEAELIAAWGPGRRPVEWPLDLRAGRVVDG